ncbi:stage V sporulation protein D [Oceanobacillus sojae]|uniref:stage V sporulation protein D n=1 Tax=Oceanobacillus sojae TaxID=582851 RepID=UPI0009885F3C|nr:stage V sporulation protein D [Oceanobacillus sojae]MCT1904231.1 stage V sporulation protein D [Oceanobacillus sojae]
MKRASTIIIKKRIVTVFLFAILIFLVIIARLAYVQLVLSDDLSDSANDLWTRDITFAAERGYILDSEGEILAENVTAPTVLLMPRQIKEPEDTAKLLGGILDVPTERMMELVTQNAMSVMVRPEGIKINNEQEQAIRELDLDGVYLAKDSKRHYPNNSALSHVLGFTGIDNQGLMGLELYYDDKLKGENGSLSFYSDAKGGRLDQLADEYKSPKDGLNLKTTINNKVTTIMERELDQVVAKYNPDGAMAIAVDPKTGGVLGMSSRPNFDPENYQDVDASIFGRNLPIWSTYEPGSTFKIITLAAALEEGVVDLEKDRYYDDGDIKVGGATIHCWKRGGHGDQSYLEVVQNSCNPGFVNLGQMLGTEKLFSYIDAFGFGKKTGIDLQGEGNGILFKPENVGPVELATTSFGQGVSVTPIQQVMAVAATVNGGYLYEPMIAKEWVDPVTGEVVESYEPHLKGQVISQETSKTIRETLETVVAQGTGRPAYVDGYRVGGKTGTAQKVGPNGGYLENNYIVSFIGFAPADDPEIVVYLAVDNPKNTIQFGGVVAAPVVGTIIDDSLRAMGVEKRIDGLEKEYAWPDQPKIEVPDFIGDSTDKLAEYPLDLSIEVNGEGEEIIDQSPKAGTMLESGSTIRLFLGHENNR